MSKAKAKPISKRVQKAWPRELERQRKAARRIRKARRVTFSGEVVTDLDKSVFLDATGVALLNGTCVLAIIDLPEQLDFNAVKGTAAK